MDTTIISSWLGLTLVVVGTDAIGAGCAVVDDTLRFAIRQRRRTP